LPDLQRRWRPHHTKGVSGLSNIGEELRSAREAQGRTIQEASAATRIRPSYLEAIEGERFDELGGNVYAKGFIRSYAGYLGVDPAPLLEVYRSGEPPEAPVFERAPRALSGGLAVERRRRGRSNWLLVGIVFLSIVLVASLWSLLKPASSASQTTLNATPPPTAAPTTAAAAPTTTIAPKPQGVTLVLNYVGASWTKVTTDGKTSFQGVGATSTTKTFKGKRTIDLTLGAPSQVKVTFNGKPVVPNRTGSTWHHTFKAPAPSKNQTTAQGGPTTTSTGG
jgi:cytoskeleton protein RodZ